MAEMSLRAYARHRGVTLRAVQKAIESGRISRNANGKIEPDTADASWHRNTDPAMRRNPALAIAVAPPSPPLFGGELLPAPENLREHAEWPDWVEELVRREPPLSAPEVLSSPGVSPEAVGFIGARANREYWDAVTARLKALNLAKELVDKRSTEREIISRAQAERDSLLTWPSRVSAILAAELGVEEPRLRGVLDRELRAYLQERSRIGRNEKSIEPAPGDGSHGSE